MRVRFLTCSLLIASLAATPVHAQASRAAIEYRLRIDDADTTAFHVTMRLRAASTPVRIAWAKHPEYDDRFWRHVVDMRASSVRGPLAVVLEDSAVWRVDGAQGLTTVTWRVSPPVEQLPRAAWRPFLSRRGALVGGIHAFPYVVGAESAPAVVQLDLPDGWESASGLTRLDGRHRFRARDALELSESPILVGPLHRWGFRIRGVHHRVAYWSRQQLGFDTATFVGGVERLAQQGVALFGQMPYRDYQFLFQDEAYGGLEHPNSVTLGAPADALTRNPHATLGETAHEFVHTWNLMAIRPAEYTGVSWRQVVPSPLYWFAEGLTMFYADALVRRAGLPAGEPTREVHVAALLERLLGNPTYARFSPESLSRVAYNAGPGALGDYDGSVHLAGEVVGTMLDLMIREATRDRRSMDDVMRLLMRRFGDGRPRLRGPDIERAVADVCRCDAAAFFATHVRGARPVDFERWLGVLGLRAMVARAPEQRNGAPAPDWRAWAWVAPDGRLRLRLMHPETAWGRAGLHTGDHVTAINGSRVISWPDFRAAISRLRIGDSVHVNIGEPAGSHRTVSFVMQGYDRPSIRLEERPDATPAQRARLARWRGGF